MIFLKRWFAYSFPSHSMPIPVSEVADARERVAGFKQSYVIMSNK